MTPLTYPEALAIIESTLLPACRQTIALGEAATRGNWQHDLNGYIAVADSDGEWGPTLLMSPGLPDDQDKANCAFAAHCQPHAVQQARALLLTVEALIHIASEKEGPIVNGSFDEPTSAYNARKALIAIAEQHRASVAGEQGGAR